MIEYKNFDLYAGETVDKQLVISFDGGTITNEDLHQEEFELTESLCSDSQLTFGSCEASEVKFRISNVFTSLKDKWLTITQILNGDTENPFQFGRYKVYSDKPTADRSYRDVVAYDSMYDIINADVASWYNSLTFPMQLKSFRDSFFDYFGIDQEEVALVNDAMTIEKTIEPSVLSGKDVLQSICQINGCFGHIGRDGKMQYVFLKRSIDGDLFPDTELYPSDKLFPVKESIRNNLYPYNNLYPQDDLIPVKSISSDSTYPQIITTIPKSAYIHCYYEDYIVKKIDKLIIRQEENDVGCTVGNGDNAYIIEDNFLVCGKSQEELTEIATNTLAVIEDIEYRPITDSEVLGNPCLEVGDAIRFYTRYEIVDSYILNRTLKGIQGLVDSYVSDGEEYQSEKVNDIQTDIKQLKGKSNTLERTIEETRSTIANMEEGLQSEITQTAESIRLEVADNTGKISTIEQDIDSITQRVEDVNQELSAEIETNANQIVLGVNSQGKMVLVELSADRNTGTAFSVKADNIDLSASDVINLLAGGTINLSGKNISIDSNNFSVDSQGNMKCNNADVTGIVNATKLNATGSLRVADGNLTYDESSGLVVDGMTAYETTIVNGLTLIDSYLRFYLTAPVTSDTYLRIYTGSDWEVPEDYLYIDKALRTKGNITSENHVISKGVIMTSHSRPIKNKVGQCGLDSYRWEQIWGADGQITTSDRNEKHDINPLSEKYEDLFNRLKPITYVFNDRIRTHVGFISQDVEQALIDSEIDSKDFAGFCKGVKSEVQTIDGDEVEVPIVDKDGNTTPTYSLRYSEFIALNTHMIQRLQQKIETQQQEIEELKKSVSFLMKEIERLGVNNE